MAEIVGPHGLVALVDRANDGARLQAFAARQFRHRWHESNLASVSSSEAMRPKSGSLSKRAVMSLIRSSKSSKATYAYWCSQSVRRLSRI